MTTQAFFANPWFASLAPEDAEALLAAGRPVALPAGEVLYLQGAHCNSAVDGFCGVLSGAIKVSIMHPDGNEAILSIIEPGNWFGEPAILDSMPRAVTAIAHQDTALLVVSANKFRELMQRVSFANAIARLEARRMIAVLELLADIALQSTRTRVARRLVMLAHGDLTQAEQGRGAISVSQDNIAMMLGVSRTTLSKELQALAKSGAIALRYGQIEILDMDALRNASDN